MTPTRKQAFIRKAKDIAVSGTLSLLLLGSIPACSSEEDEVVFTKGAKTYISEVEPGVFKITDEQVVEEGGESKAYISYLNGTSDTLSIDQAKQKLESQKPDTVASTTTTGSSYHSSSSQYNNGGTVHHYNSGPSLSTILFYSAMGNMLGRSLSSPPPPMYYSSPDVYSRSQNVHSTVHGSRTVRPSSSSRGFFSGSSRSSFRS
jgi:hypothetical protein